MPSDRSKIEYAKAFLRRQYMGPVATSGALVVGKTYLLGRFGFGDDFTNVGLETNSAGLIFTATGTTPTTWTQGSRIYEILLAALKQFATVTFPEATDPVTITSTGFEGGNAAGTTTFEKSLLGMAIEELIAEFDPDYLEPTYTPRGQPWGVTVRLGC